jgi:phosphoenolpyruvate phosphomutase
MSQVFKSRLRDNPTVVVGGAHDAISARLVEEAGFDAIWLSSLGVSTAQRAVPDLNLITMTEMLSVGRHIVARVEIPVIADCENGYGDANNISYTVREFERAGVAAICVEDNAYPKKNSFYEIERSLIPIEEMVLKIKASKRAQRSEEFGFIARTEALIAGLGISAAIERGHAYDAAGADALVVHAKSWPAVEEFLRQWKGDIPLVIIPTKFPHVGVAALSTAGFKMVIYANQALRASVWTMRKTLSSIRGTGRCDHLDSGMVSLKELEGLVGFCDGTADARMIRPTAARPAGRR